MNENAAKNILFVITRDDLFECAHRLGIPGESLTDDVIAEIGKRLSLAFGNWPDMVERSLKELACPLGLSCNSSCYWWKGRCTFHRERGSPDRA